MQTTTTADAASTDERASEAMTRREEFSRHWPVVANAAAGCGLGISGILTYNSGLFINDLETAIGLSRTQFGMAFFLATLAIAVSLPAVGRVIDTKGARGPAAFGSLALAAGFLSLGTLVHSVTVYIAIMILIGLLASPSSPVAYTKAVNAVFDRGRGLALGFTQMGVGLAAALVPPLTLFFIAQFGWQVGFYALAGITLLGVLPAWLGLRDKTPRQGQRVQVLTGMPFPAVLRSRTFWMEMAAFSVMAFAFAGLLPNFVPILRDAQVSPVRIGVLASLIGVSVIVSRVVVGWLADILDPRRIMMVVCVICACGTLGLAWGGPALAPVAAIALGVAMGAEADLVGYFTARYFGMVAYGQAYAWQYSAFIVAAGLSPVWVGLFHDLQGHYNSALLVSAALLALAMVLFAVLPPFRDREIPRAR